MHRLTVLALTLLVIVASVFPPVLARETNADRLRRGYPPLPPGRRQPSRRDTAKRSGPSAVPPQTVTGVVEVRDQSGAHRLGFVSNEVEGDSSLNFLGVVGSNQPTSPLLLVSLTSGDQDLAAINPNFAPNISPTPPPPCVGPLQEELGPLTILTCARPDHWSLDPKTNELTIQAVGSSGTPRPATFAWDQMMNELEVVLPGQSANQAQPVRLFFDKSS